MSSIMRSVGHIANCSGWERWPHGALKRLTAQLQPQLSSNVWKRRGATLRRAVRAWSQKSLLWDCVPSKSPWG